MIIAVNVESIRAEYSYLSGHPCKCGGAWEVKEQKMGFSQGSPHIKIDILCAQCKQCGAAEEFLFVVDVSSPLYQPNRLS
jgi:hypothetical protein